MKPQDAIDHLTYISYKTNREQNPNIQYKRWGLVYGKSIIEKLEKQFQSEKGKK